MHAPPGDNPAPTPQNDANGANHDPTPSEILSIVVTWLRVHGPEWLGRYWNKERPKSKWTEILIVFLTLLIAIAAFWSAWLFQCQLNTMRDQLDATTRPWLEVKPEIFQHIWFSVFFDRPSTFIPITCNVVNYGQSPARNVLCNVRIDSVPPVMDNPAKATNDLRLVTLCAETNAASRKSPDSGIPVFQHRNSIAINQGADSIDDRYFKTEGTIYMVQGCVDYTYGSGTHGQTTFRYLAGVFGPDKILHGIPFSKGTPVENAPGNLIRAFVDSGKVDFVQTEGGNYAK